MKGHSHSTRMGETYKKACDYRVDSDLRDSG